ncbi:MAG: hypothetical protein JWO00_636 [Candidatus Parcubacteria bacterium]|nr:hypothetical protein [Candidatus Parcubacteria bacterium]
MQYIISHPYYSVAVVVGTAYVISLALTVFAALTPLDDTLETD